MGTLSIRATIRRASVHQTSSGQWRCLPRLASVSGRSRVSLRLRLYVRGFNPGAISTAGASIDLSSDATKLGVEGEASTHYYSRIAHAVAVQTPSGTVERRESLEDRQLATWIAYVDDKRGWSDLNNAESFAGILLEALRGGD